MESFINEIQQALKKYDLDLDEKEIKEYIHHIEHAQQYFPLSEQRALIIKLLNEWENRKDKKVINTTSEACNIKHGPCVTTFGILSVDWPGLSDTCLGIIHEMGWNIYFTKSIIINYKDEDLGIILIGVKTDDEESYSRLRGQCDTILKKIYLAAEGATTKTFLISEQMKKIELYSETVSYIKSIYHDDDIDEIIGYNGEAVKYFAARSTDYIENRKIEDIAAQIIRNHKFIKRVLKTGDAIELDISNFKTKREGEFTGVTVAGLSRMLHLEDCLKTIELTSPDFQLKHNREFTTPQGISVFRIEFVDSSGNPLSELERKRLRKGFSIMVLNKQKERAQWIESIGGFEQYARAIIPLLVREAKSSKQTQVYQSVAQATDLFIDFKIIIALPEPEKKKKHYMNITIDSLEQLPGFHIHKVRPPRQFSGIEIFIVDLRVNLSEIDNVETIYRRIKEKLQSAIGDFRDFDEGMRTIDVLKLKSIRKKLEGINKTLLKELYYGIEDFFRISASEDEIIDHIRIVIDMIKSMGKNGQPLKIISRRTGTYSKSGKIKPKATLICLSYPHNFYLLQKILNILEPYDVILSRIEKSGRDILICRITKNDKVLSGEEKKKILVDLKSIVNGEKVRV